MTALKNFKLKDLSSKFGFVARGKASKDIDQKILELSNELSELDGNSEDYDSLVARLEKLINVRNAQQKSKVDRNEIIKFATAGLGSATTILALTMILKYENSGEIITSKAFSVASKLIGR